MIMPFPLPFIVRWAGNHLGVEGTANEDEIPVFVQKHGNDLNLVSRAKGYDHYTGGRCTSCLRDDCPGDPILAIFFFIG